MQKWLIGIDEAGRGPLAGPVSVGAVCVPAHFDFDLIPGVTDSKKLSARKRQEIFQQAVKLKEEGKIQYAVSLASASVIDKKGITKAVGICIERVCNSLAVDPQDTLVKLDGLLRAPEVFVYQETIIKGDQKEKVIGLASILAKVTRDTYMERIAKRERYAPYLFEMHKGYGTKAHCELISTYGLSDLHRRSFCSRWLP